MTISPVIIQEFLIDYKDKVKTTNEKVQLNSSRKGSWSR